MSELRTYSADLGPVPWVGVAGVTCSVVAFAAVQCGRLDGNNTALNLANTSGASLVATSLAAEFTLASASIQIGWILLAVLGLALQMSRAGPATRGHRDTPLDHTGAR